MNAAELLETASEHGFDGYVNSEADCAFIYASDGISNLGYLAVTNETELNYVIDTYVPALE